MSIKDSVDIADEKLRIITRKGMTLESKAKKIISKALDFKPKKGGFKI